MDLEAFVLHSIDYKDSGKILYLYSVHGHQSVLAHGVKKLNNINRFLSQSGTLIHCQLSKAQFPVLKDGELINDYEYIKTDVIAYTYMNHIMELVRNTIPDDSDHLKMYSFLQKLFTNMNRKQDPELLTFVFELKLLHFLGNGLQFHQCSICDETEEVVFHISSGGLVCKKHLDNMDHYYEEDVYRFLKYLYYMDVEQHPLPELEPNYRLMIRHIIDALYDEFVGYHSKSRDILRQIKKY